MDIDGTLVLVGAGKMGAALLNGWIADGLAPEKIAIFDPAPLPAIAAL
ncbi:MAG TPA: pyrroline-5-carboxylate reductase, partial [Alphaproteobacteria bacterium]|nr:pyrroline-5-carboxylate reductase [Alphaproteobacteria bacterium]HBC55148.1 pyrroline-5-carboxylate reductase [Alphaproteobacteria bacterium]